MSSLNCFRPLAGCCCLNSDLFKRHIQQIVFQFPSPCGVLLLKFLAAQSLAGSRRKEQFAARMYFEPYRCSPFVLKIAVSFASVGAARISPRAYSTTGFALSLNAAFATNRILEELREVDVVLACKCIHPCRNGKGLLHRAIVRTTQVRLLVPFDECGEVAPMRLNVSRIGRGRKGILVRFERIELQSECITCHVEGFAHGVALCITARQIGKKQSTLPPPVQDEKL